VLTYYITDRAQFAGTEPDRRSQLLQTIRQAASAEVDYIQLREKDLCARELESLAREALHLIRSESSSKLLINHRTDIALALGADGVHLTGADIAASDARALTASAHRTEPFLIAASCHSSHEVRLAESHGADFAVLAPIFEKIGIVKNGIGLEELSRAAQKDKSLDLRVEAGEARRTFPVFALGGLDLQRAALCANAGAAGIAGIRLFQQCANLQELVRTIRSL